MISSLTQEELYFYLSKQLMFIFPDDNKINKEIMKIGIKEAIERCEYCFLHIINEQYHKGDKAYFSHLHGDQYATFIYFLSNSIWMRFQEKVICDKLLNLQRVLHGFFLSYKCPMPNIFYLNHPIGSIIGNAIYSDGLCISQNVTINTHIDKNGKLDLYIGKGVFLGPGSKIIGNKKIGDRVSVGADVILYNKEIKDDMVAINENGNIIIRKRKKEKCLSERVMLLD